MFHVSVGHFARVLEERGIPTVAIFIRARKHRAEEMNVPRTLVTQHPMGRTVGGPFDVERQSAVVRSALELLDSAGKNGTLEVFPDPYRIPASR